MENKGNWRKISLINNIARKFIKGRGSTATHIKNNKTLPQEDKHTALSKPKNAEINCKVCIYYKIDTSYKNIEIL